MKMKLSNDKYRPGYHYSPPSGWMNDPNGLVFLNGEYHLFYQYYPYGTQWGSMHWGHAVSTDLIHWKHLPIALFPDKLGTIFSGSAVADHENTTSFGDGKGCLVAVFTHFKYGLQRQSLAYSNDGGQSWMKYKNNPVLKNPFKIHFRDPKVFWHHNSQRWIMLIACGDHVRFYSSPDMKNWMYTGQFGQKEGAHGSVWECPDLFEMQAHDDPESKKWVMLVSIKKYAPNGGSGIQYFTGHFNGKAFCSEHHPSQICWLDYGKDNYAGVTWNNIPESDNRRIYIGWMNNWQYARNFPTQEWRGAMTIPRELTLRKTMKGYRLFSAPVAETLLLRNNKQEFSQIRVQDTFLIKRDIRNGNNAFELELQADMKKSDEFSISLVSGDHTQTLSINKKKAMLAFQRVTPPESRFSRAFDGNHQAPLDVSSGKISLRMLADNCSLEFFFNEGEVSLTELILPSGIIDCIQIHTPGSPVLIEKLILYELNQ